MALNTQREENEVLLGDILFVDVDSQKWNPQIRVARRNVLTK